MAQTCTATPGLLLVIVENLLVLTEDIVYVGVKLVMPPLKSQDKIVNRQGFKKKALITASAMDVIPEFRQIDYGICVAALIVTVDKVYAGRPGNVIVELCVGSVLVIFRMFDEAVAAIAGEGKKIAERILCAAQGSSAP